MKKFLHFLSAVFVLCALATVLTLSAAAKAEFEMEIPYGTPTVDGVIDEGEYESTYVMDKTTATAWVGEVGESSVTWHLAWDEGGLYYAGTINDSTPSWRSNDHYWVGIDCLELAINPGRILKGRSAEGVFFSFGSARDGSVVAWRHNFADGLVSDEVIGANTGHVEGTNAYTMEVYIPWSLVQIDEYCTVGGKENIHLDATGWEAKAGAQLGLLPCAIDSFDKDGEDIIAYKFNGTDFLARDFVVATLMGNGEATEADTADVGSNAVTEETTTEVAQPDNDAPTSEDVENSSTAADTDGGMDAAQPKGCFGTLSVGIVVALTAAAGVLIRKRKE